ncbi:hypothetical protein ZWY2020_049723 [Hordeum vulgare]|nr:hypothetical protein ZWY2020_049723 [Hordeum vulgare]
MVDVPCPHTPDDVTRDDRQERVFVGTWNVGGKNPNDRLNLQDFLQVDGVLRHLRLGVSGDRPLTAGNVLVLEDNEPAARWLALIHQALNHPQEQADSDEPPPQPSEPGPADAARQQQNRRRDAMATRSSSGNLFFQTPSLKVLSNSYRVDSALVKTCNCSPEASLQRRRATEVRESVYRAAETPPASTAAEATSTAAGGWDDDGAAGTPGQCEPPSAADGGGMSYCLIASKQMVGLFLSVWVKKELVEHVGHLRVDCVGRGIMRHLASGEKEGDEVRRNADVAEILKSAHFPRACKSPSAQRVLPERILEHDKMIWLGDLNYRVSLSYEETRTLLEENDWDALLEKDQLMIEREAGGCSGLEGGKISFAPTYKYTQNSDACDRMLWHGDGIEQLRYLGQSRFSDHRPVWGVFAVEVEAGGGRRMKLLLHVRADQPTSPGRRLRHNGSGEPSS